MTTNLQSKTLIANWVEEVKNLVEQPGLESPHWRAWVGEGKRQCAHLEDDNRKPDGTLSTKLHREGHTGILSTEQGAAMEASTTVKDSYTPPPPPAVRITGKRQDMLRQQLYDMVSSQVHEEFHPPPPPMEYCSTTKKDFNRDCDLSKIPPTREHDVHTDQPVSYWTENINAITGVTQVAHRSPFCKNAAFSTPIEEYLDQPKPHGIA